MLRTKKLKYFQLLISVSLICLNSCTSISSEHCPLYPIAGSKVAKDIEKVDSKDAEAEAAPKAKRTRVGRRKAAETEVEAPAAEEATEEAAE